MKAHVFALVVSFVLAAQSFAQPLLMEPPEFPDTIPGPSVAHPGTGCVLLATGTITPSDVDWVQLTLPFASARTVVDVDIATTGNSALLASIVGASSRFNIDDNNNDTDGVCGLGADTDPPGSPQDSVVDLGVTTPGAVMNIGVTGGDDAGFTGDHAASFTYEVWVFAEGEPLGCVSDEDCDDSVSCTVDSCDTQTGLCGNEPDDDACDDGLFCNGMETCDQAGGCLTGQNPCAPGETCDESDGCRTQADFFVDIRPGECPNNLSVRARGYIPVAFVGTDNLDVTRIDLTTIELTRADAVGGSVIPHDGPPGPHSTIQDVTAPFAGNDCECASLAPDGQPDLLMFFPVEALTDALELDTLTPRMSVPLAVSAALLDGTAVRGIDCVRIVGMGQPRPGEKVRR